MKSFFSAICLTLCLATQQLSSYEFDQNTRLVTGYATGRFISIDEDYARMGLVLPVFCCNGTGYFIDGRAYRFNNGKWAASGGLGLRHDFGGCGWGIVGVNAFYDYRRGCSKSNFNQIGFGLEWFYDCFEIRANGYLPVSTKTRTCKTCIFNDIGNGFEATKKHVEFPYKGLDVEVGLPLVNHERGVLYAGAGPYYYHTTYNRFWGGFGRFAWYIGSVFSAEVRFSWDPRYKWNAQGYAQISLPFNLFCSPNCCCSDLFCKPVHRNDMILTNKCCRWRWNWQD